VTVSIAADTSGTLSGIPRVKRERTSTFRGCTLECRGTSSTSSKVRAVPGRKLPMAKVTGGPAVPQPSPGPSSPPLPPPLSAPPAACPRASPPPSGTARPQPGARRTSTRETRRSRAPDRPSPRGARPACATGGRAGSRSWQRLQRHEVEHRIAEEPGATGAHAGGDLHGRERGEGIELEALRL